MEKSSDIFSTDPRIRLQASKQNEGKNVDRWPFGNGGSTNAYVVLLGPSPGKDHTGNHDANDVGIGMHSLYFKDQKNRNKNWHALNLACFGALFDEKISEDMCNYLTGLHNLVSLNSSSELDIASAMDAGCSEEWARLRQVKPVVVVPLSLKTFDSIKRFAEKNGSEFKTEEPPTFPGYGKPLLAFSVGLDAPLHRTLFVKPPQHPSRPLRRPNQSLPQISIPDMRTKPVEITVKWFMERETYI